MILQNYNWGNGIYAEQKTTRGGGGGGGGGGGDKKPDFLRAISPEETGRIFFDGRAVSTPQKLSNLEKI